MAAETRGHEWDTRWQKKAPMLTNTCRLCGAVEQAHENGRVWMSQDISPDEPCPGKENADG